jgi:ABC-type nickel/cobalt efflux system permease component RcnA
MVSYIAVNRYDWRQSAKLGLLFNIPRIIILTVLGGVVGYIVHAFSTSVDLDSYFSTTGQFGYVLLGIFLLIFGGYWLTKSIEARENLKEGKKTPPDLCKDEDKGKKHGWLYSKINAKFSDPKTQPKYLFLLWGGILSIACLGEIILVEMPVISGTAALLGNEALGATLLGATSMLIFATGAAIPIMYVVIIGSTISMYVKSQETLESIKTIGAIMMIFIGLAYFLTSVGSLLV